MKNKNLFLIWTSCFILTSHFILVSCASSKFEGNAAFVGKVYDQNGKAVPNYEIEIKGEKKLTDSAGIFYFDSIPSGKIQARGQKKGFTTLNKKIYFTERKEFFSFEVEEISCFYKKIESLVNQKKYNEASSMLKVERKSNGEEVVFRFYETLCDFYKSDSIEKKEDLKEKLGILLKEYNKNLREVK